MVYLKGALVYLAVLIAVSSSQPRYGQRRPAKYLPPKRTYNPVKEVIKTYNPVKEVVKTYNPIKKVVKTYNPVKKATHPKHSSGLDPIGAILPDVLPGEGGFFPDNLSGGIGRISDQRRTIGGSDIPWGPPDVNRRISRRNGRRDRLGGFPSDPLGQEGFPLLGGTGSRNQFPSSIDRIGRPDVNPWTDRDISQDPLVGRDAFPWTDRNRDRSLGGQIPSPDFIDRPGDRDPRGSAVGGFLDGGIGGDRTPNLRDLNPGLTARLRSAIRDPGSNARLNRGFRSRDGPLRGVRDQFLPNRRESQNW